MVHRSKAKIATLAMLGWLGCGVLSAADSSCEDCHAQREFFVQARHLHDYYQDWLASPHKAGGVQCEHCHGGNPGAADQRVAHDGIYGTTDPASNLYYRRQPDTCGSCHAEKSAAFVNSDHYATLMGAQTTAPTCTTCHQAMSRKPYYRDITTRACRTCHEAELEAPEPDVVDRVAEILHRLSIAGAYLGWTRLYYEQRDWPDGARAEFAELEAVHDRAVTGIHAFDLDRSEQNSIDVLTHLKALFDAISEAQTQARAGEND
jgi:hypothetical protein